MPLKVYLNPCTINCGKVLAGLELLDIPFVLKHADFLKGEHKSEWYAKINPFAAIDGDMVLTESNAILQYAADTVCPTSTCPNNLSRRQSMAPLGDIVLASQLLRLPVRELGETPAGLGARSKRH